MASRSVDRFEGFGIVFLVAALCKKASVAGNQGGVSEAVEDGVTGLLVDPTNSDAVAEAIVRLLEDTEYREELACRAYVRASTEFNLERMAERLLDGGELSAPAPLSGFECLLSLAHWGFQLALSSLQRLPRALFRRIATQLGSRPDL
jgi:hypothetical protein